MAVWMQPIQLSYRKKHHEPHGVEQTRGTRCHGCPEMSCIPQRSRREPWRFYCERMRKRVEPAKLSRADCPLGRNARRGRPPKR
ncbi:MAG: hypothetical protein IJ087_18180 [Eggerthellaceae bacterium]|nr:hypothetical protein [Eggerthellaceae bacterium]